MPGSGTGQASRSVPELPHGHDLVTKSSVIKSSVDDGIVSISHRGRVGPDPCGAAPAGQGARRAATQTKAAGVTAAAADRGPVGDPQGRRLRVDQFRWDGVSGRQTAGPASGHDPFREHGAFANAGGRCSLT